jgi:exodeoxyribonuclease V alpha subunit
LVTKNLPSLNLANGDCGHLHLASRSAARLRKGGRAALEDRASFFGREFPANLLPAFDFGFALSIHKSQGSECDFPSIILGEGSDKFDRSLLYTAITRAKKGLTLVAKRDLLERILSKPKPERSGLLARF